MPITARSRRLSGGFSMLALIVATPALAGDIDAKSRIDAVVVYPDAAAVTRVVDIDLPAGSSTLVLRGLPIGLDPASLRVEGAALGGMSIGAVETRVAPAVEAQKDTAIEAKLKSLRSDREGWQATLDALDAKKAMMIRFSQAGPEKLSPESKPLDISQWQSAWDVVGQGLARIGDDLRAARAGERVGRRNQGIGAGAAASPNRGNQPRGQHIRRCRRRDKGHAGVDLQGRGRGVAARL